MQITGCAWNASVTYTHVHTHIYACACMYMAFCFLIRLSKNIDCYSLPFLLFLSTHTERSFCKRNNKLDITSRNIYLTVTLRAAEMAQ